MVGILNYFGLGGSSPVKEDNTSLRALPANWYTSQEMYELERRAIFSRKWMLITHKVRLGKAGDFLRHRAFPVVLEDKGNAKIFSCGYHGWSYGLNGKLAKAPGYQDLSGFDKEQNGLFPIHLHIDCNGFIWINLDGGEDPEIAWEDGLGGTDRQERYKDFNFDDYVFDHTWQMDGAYNWKILADNYNECYHCATAHPDISALANLQSYSVKTADAQILHNPATTEEQRKAGLTVASTYYFPNASTNVTPHFFMIQKFVPNGPTSSSMMYEVFRNKHSSQEDFELVNQIYKRIMSEDKYLCDLAQKNLNAGVFVNGEMHPRMEKGPLYFQKVVRDTVKAHYELERLSKHEVWPARQTMPDTAKVSKGDIAFCSGLSCSANQEGLAW